MVQRTIKLPARHETRHSSMCHLSETQVRIRNLPRTKDGTVHEVAFLWWCRVGGTLCRYPGHRIDSHTRIHKGGFAIWEMKINAKSNKGGKQTGLQKSTGEQGPANREKKQYA